MSDEFHYVRTPGEEGGVDVCDGPAIGLDLETILLDGLPPWSVALEIIAALCEILDIADEDGEIHGNITPEFIFLDETGAISLEGYGKGVNDGRAPESPNADIRTDLHGLGYTAYRCVCSKPMEDLPATDAATYDDAMIDQVLLVDLDGVPEEMQGDIQWFLAKLTSFSPDDRPSAVEAWRTFIAFAGAIDGPDFIDWCAAALEGEGERRKDAQRELPAEGASAEDLQGPVLQKGPLAAGAISFGDSAAKGQATAFWTRDAMKAALEAENEAEEENETYRPQVGGGSATAFWSKDQMQAMVEGSSEAPRPKRAQGMGEQRAATRMLKADQIRSEGAADPAPPASPPRSPPPPISGPTSAPGPVASGPVEPQQTGGKSKAPMIIGAVVVLLLLGGVCLGVGGLGAGVAFLGGDDTESSSDIDVAPKPEPEPKDDAGTKDTAPAKKAKTEEAKPKPKPRPKPKSGGSASPKPRPKAKPAPEPEPEPEPAASGPANITFKSNGRGSVSCAGDTTQFDAAANFTIDEYQLPATCLVTIDGKRGVFQVHGSGAITCDLESSNVICNKSVVP